jgi:hypothetical protein
MWHITNKYRDLSSIFTLSILLIKNTVLAISQINTAKTVVTPDTLLTIVKAVRVLTSSAMPTIVKIQRFYTFITELRAVKIVTVHQVS